MRLFYFFSILFIGLFSCNKNDADRKMRLVKIHNGNELGFPTYFEYDAQGFLHIKYVDYKGVTDAGEGNSFHYENGRLSEIIKSYVSIAGFWQTVHKLNYTEDGRIKSMKEEVLEGRPETLMRYEFGYKDSNRHFDSCKVYITQLNVEKPYQLYTFTRDNDGNILSQTVFTRDENNWIINHKEEFTYGIIDNPEYEMGSPAMFRNYYSKKIATKIVRHNPDGSLFSEKKFIASRILPSTILVRNEQGEALYYKFN